MNTTSTPGKKLFSALLILVMMLSVLSALSLSALAGDDAIASVTVGGETTRFTDADELFAALRAGQYSGATVTFLTDVTITEAASIESDVTIDLNGKALRADGNSGLLIGAKVTILSSGGEGTIDVTMAVDFKGDDQDPQLTMGTGIGDVKALIATTGKITIYSGRYKSLSGMVPGDMVEDITLCGGSYGSISLRNTVGYEILGKNYRFREMLSADAIDTYMSNVTVELCDHTDIIDATGFCVGCGVQRVFSVETDDALWLFERFDEAILLAKQNDGSTVKLWENVTFDGENEELLRDGGNVCLNGGAYTLDLAGKTMNIGNLNLVADGGCRLTITDSVGGGKVMDAGTGSLQARADGRLTIAGGDFTGISRVEAYSRESLTLSGGSFRKLRSFPNDAAASPLNYLADGYAFAPGISGDMYANESAVRVNFVDNTAEYYIEDVTVTKAPVAFTEDGQPKDQILYPTTPDDKKQVSVTVSCLDITTIKATLEMADGSKLTSSSYQGTEKPLVIKFSLAHFTEAVAGQYRIRLECNGYVLCSDLFTVSFSSVECQHPGYTEDVLRYCSQCGAQLAAAITLGDTTTGYLSATDAFAAAQTAENRGCTLILFAHTEEAGKLAVKTGKFTIEGDGYWIGALQVSKGAELTINDAKISGKTVCAKGGKLTANKTDFKETVNCVGEGNFTSCSFNKNVQLTNGGNATFDRCTLGGTFSVTKTVVAKNCMVIGDITVNNGGTLTIEQDDADASLYRSNILVKTGARLYLLSGSCSGTITAESGSEVTLRGGSTANLTAKSGSTLTIEGGDHANVFVNEGVTLTLSGGYLGEITVKGQRLIDSLADGRALFDVGNNTVIDGRVKIASNVRVIDGHIHDCYWITKTHEKLCGCGFVEQTDTEAPVISAIDGNTYYFLCSFTVTDANDFIVTVDGVPVTLYQGQYILSADNKEHTITATDVAGNTASVTVKVYKMYEVKLPSGVGYKITGAPLACYGTDYVFTVEIAEGYSKTPDFVVKVNGTPIDSVDGNYTFSGFEETLTITVDGVADITPPEAEIAIGTNKFKEFLNTVTFGLFFKQTQTVSVTATDAGSGIGTIEYLLSDTVFADEAGVSGDWVALSHESGKATLQIEPNRKAYLYLRVTDASGNARIINSEGVVVYTDSEAITASIRFTMLEENDLPFLVRLNGNTVRALYNDTTLIDSENYTVAADGTITLKNAYLKTLAAGEYTLCVAYDPMGETYGEGDEPAMTTVGLAVGKAETTISFFPNKFNKEYDGQPIRTPGFTTSRLGTVSVEYKPYGADDSAYSTVAPKDAGKYVLRVSVAESDTHRAAVAERDYEILKKSITIIGAAVEPSKIYDGNTDATITAAGTPDGVIDGDVVTVVAGKAAYSGRNVGTGKTVTFTDFALAGDAAANYELTTQPQSVTADITAKALTIDGLKVKDKPFDGSSTAEIDGVPTLIGVVDGDEVQLLNGIPTFGSTAIGTNIPITFTEFTLRGGAATLANYTLTQPTGITANITEYRADRGAYSVNSNGWIRTDFVVTAKSGYLLSLTGAANGTWTTRLTASAETASGSLTFYVKNTATGAISAPVTETYRIDKTVPTGEILLNGQPTSGSGTGFGLFFGVHVNVRLTATDDASGISSVRYYRSDRALTDSELRAVTDWTEKSNFDIEAKDAERFIIYARIEDNAGNVSYLASDGATFDTTAPEIVGVEDGNTYYFTKKVAIDDENLASVTLNGAPVDGMFSLAGNTDATYVIRAVDRAGNVTEVTVTMKPISSVTDAMAKITIENVKSSDAGTVSAVARQLLDLSASFDEEESTEAEWKELTEATAKCKELEARIAETAGEITRLTEGVNAYDIDRVTSDDRAAIEALTAGIDTLLGGDYLTDSERAALETLRKTAQALLDRLAAAKAATEGDEITNVKDVTGENVTLGDKDALQAAKEALEGALRDFGDNLTEEERRTLETALDNVKSAASTIDNAEGTAKEIESLPSPADVSLSDKNEVERVRQLTDALSENEKAMVGKDALSKLDALTERIDALAAGDGKDDPNDPNDPNDTEKTGNGALWITLSVVGGIVVLAGAAVLVVRKKKTHSVK